MHVEDTPPKKPFKPHRGSSSIAVVVLIWAVLILLCWSVIGVVLAPLLPGGWLSLAALGVVSLTPIRSFVRGMHGKSYPGAAFRILVLRPFWYTMLALPLLALATLFGLGGGLLFGAPDRWGLVGFTTTLLCLLTLALWGYAGSRRLVTRRIVLRHDALPKAFDGLRIAHVSDLHVGPHTSRSHLERVAETLGRIEADLIAVTGDQVDDHAADVAIYQAALSDLRAPLGVYAVAGNHDVYAGWDSVRAGLEAAGHRVLVNQAEAVRRDGAEIWIVGMGDPAGEYHWSDGSDVVAPDMERAFREVPAGAFSLVLAHNPAMWDQVRAHGGSVTLSGHTHYGQLAIRSLGWCLASLFLRYAMGLHYKDGASLYINPGTNFWGIPFRIGALPEITILELRAEV